MSQEFVPDDNLSDRPNSDSAISEQDVVLLTVVGSPSWCQGNHTHFVPAGICPSRRLESRTACG
jgi:hypothetical protein